MRKILVLLLLLFPSLLYAQGQQVNAGPFTNAGLLYVCPVPSGGTPCPTPSSIFRDSGLTQPLSNPISTPAQTIITFYASPGQYTLEMPASGVQQVINVGGGGGTTPFSSISSGTNTSAAMLVGSGASLDFTGTGLIDANKIATATVSTLPAPAGANGETYWVTDGNGAGNCTVGSGPSLVLCRSNGAAWIPIAQNTGLSTLTAIRLSQQCGAADTFCFPVFQDANVSIGSTWAANTSNGTTATALTTNVNDMGAQYLQFNTAQANIGGIFTTTGSYYTSILAAFKISGTLGAPASCSGTNEIAGSATTITVAITPASSGSGSILIAFAAAFNPDGVSMTFSDNNGNTWANVLPESVITPTLATSQMGYVQNNNSGATTVTATFGVAATFRSIFVCNFSGMASSGVLDAAAGGFRQSSTIMAGTVTTSGNDLLFQAARSGISTFTVGTLGVAANTVTTNAFDPPFTSADVGKKVVLSTSCGAANGFIGPCLTPLTNPFAKVATFTDAHHIVINSLMAIANTAPDAHGFTGWLIDGHDDSVQYAAAFQKALTIVGAALYLPCGMTMIGSQPFNETTNPIWNPDVIGCGGESSTIMVPTLDFNYFGANGGLFINIPNNNVIFVTPTVQTPNIYGKVERFSIFGAGLPGAGTLPIFNLSNEEIDSVDCTGYAAQTFAGGLSSNNFINAGVGTTLAVHLNFVHDWICGNVGLNFAGGIAGSVTNSYWQPGGTAMIVAGGDITSSGNIFYGNGAACSGNANNSIEVTGGDLASYHDAYRGLFINSGIARLDSLYDSGIGLCQGLNIAGGSVSSINSLIDKFTQSAGTFTDLGFNYHTAPGTTWQNGTFSISGGTINPVSQGAYNTSSAASAANLTLVSMATAGSIGNKYTFSGVATQVAAGTSCTGNTLLGLTVNYTDPVTNSAVVATLSGNSDASAAYTASQVLASGNGGPGQHVYWLPVPVNAKASTAVTYTVTYTLGTGCSPGPTYYFQPVLTLVQ